MRLGLEVRDRATKEFIEGYLWYENQRDGLGEEFHDEVQEHFDFLCEHGKGMAKWRGPYKRITLKRFPYIIIYRVVRDTVVVFSVFHAKRDPKRWGHHR